MFVTVGWTNLTPVGNEGPEPSTDAMMLGGLAGGWLLRQRRSRP